MSMFDQKVRVLSEGLARTINRRDFLKNAGTTMFVGIAALAAGHSLGGTVTAKDVPNPCSPPISFCNTGGGDLSGCHGAHCFQNLYNGQVLQCRVEYQYYQAGCWTAPSGGGYWTCCDCECLQNGVRVTECGCAQYSGSPIPSPDGPSGNTRA